MVIIVLIIVFRASASTAKTTTKKCELRRRRFTTFAWARVDDDRRAARSHWTILALIHMRFYTIWYRTSQRCPNPMSECVPNTRSVAFPMRRDVLCICCCALHASRLFSLIKGRLTDAKHEACGTERVGVCYWVQFVLLHTTYIGVPYGKVEPFHSTCARRRPQLDSAGITGKSNLHPLRHRHEETLYGSHCLAANSFPPPVNCAPSLRHRHTKPTPQTTTLAPQKCCCRLQSPVLKCSTDLLFFSYPAMTLCTTRYS